MAKINHISKVEIFGLWDRYDLVWNLNSDVNILSGINGSGKTTILDYICGLVLLGVVNEKTKRAAEKIIITFNNNKHITYDYLKVNESIKNLEKKAKVDDKFKSVVEDLKEKEGSNYNRIKSIKFEMGFTSDNLDMTREELTSDLLIDVISTFDAPLKVSEAVKKLSDDDVITELDLEIYHLQKKYLDYQLSLGKQVFEIVSNTDSTSKEEISKIKRGHEMFLDIVDNLFRETGKKIDRKENELKFKCGKNSISAFELSSGEKQILVILLTVLIQNNQKAILFMDEPEISLHLDWQKKLLKFIQELNPNAQVILATHSPAVIMEGWLDKVS